MRIDAARDDGGVSSDVPNLMELTATTEKNRFDFLQKDLGLCLTLVDLARTELEVDGPEAAHRVLVKAQDGYATIARFLPGVENAERRIELERTLSDLRTALDGMQCQLQP